MKLREIVDQSIRSVDGGVSTIDSKFSRPAIKALAPKWRSDAIIITHNGNRETASNQWLNAALYQSLDITIVPSVQVTGTAFVRFSCPNVIQLDRETNGFIFVGDLDTGINFQQIKSPAEYAQANAAKLISDDEVYYYQVQNYIYVRGNIQLKSFHIDGIFADPLQISGFNPETDEYPVSPDILKKMLQLAYADLALQAGRPADTINDGVSTLERPANKKSVV